MSAPHCPLTPLQKSGASQAPALARHSTVVFWNRSIGQTRQTGADLGRVANADSAAADGVGRHECVAGARRAAARARFGRVTAARRRATHLRRQERVGRARRRRAGAHLCLVARALQRAAHGAVGAQLVGRADGRHAIARLCEVAVACGGAAHCRATAHDVAGARQRHAVAHLGHVAAARQRGAANGAGRDRRVLALAGHAAHRRAQFRRRDAVAVCLALAGAADARRGTRADAAARAAIGRRADVAGVADRARRLERHGRTRAGRTESMLPLQSGDKRRTRSRSSADRTRSTAAGAGRSGTMPTSRCSAPRCRTPSHLSHKSLSLNGEFRALSWARNRAGVVAAQKGTRGR